MSSLTRNMQRRVARAAADYEPRSQFTQAADDGSYVTLHPTKGFRSVCAARAELGVRHSKVEVVDRLEAMMAMPYLGPRAKPSRIYHPLNFTPMPVGTVTRQQRRAAARYGVEVAA